MHVENSLIPHLNPNFSYSHLLINKGKAVNYTLQLSSSDSKSTQALFINLNNKTAPIDKVSGLSTLSSIGLSYQFNQAAQTLTISGTPTSDQAINLSVTAQNSVMRSDSSLLWTQAQVLALSSSAKPVPKTISPLELGAGKSFTPLTKADFFSYPVGASSITLSTPKVFNKQGKQVPLSVLGLEWTSQQSLVKAKSVADVAMSTNGSPYTIELTATDAAGSASNSFHAYFFGGKPFANDILPQTISTGNKIVAVSAVESFFSFSPLTYGVPTIKNARGNSVSLSSLNLAWSNNTLSSGAGGLPSNSYINQPYTVTFYATNSSGTTPNNFTLNVTSRPVPKTLSNEHLQPGVNITPVSGADAFIAPSNSGAISYQTPTIINESGASVSLSALNLTWSNNTLSSSAVLPNSGLANSPYTITFHASNSIGSQTNSFQLHLEADKPIFSGLPTSLTVKEGQVYNTTTPLINLASHISPADGTLTNVTVALDSGTLAKSGLSLVHNSSYSEMAIVGTPNHEYAGETKTLTITATNSFGLTNTATIPLTYAGLPRRNGTQDLTYSYEHGMTITSINLANFFNNPPNSGSLTFDGTLKESIQVTAPNGDTSSFADSALATAGSGGNKLTLQNNIISGSISDKATGTYLITVHAKNGTGYSQGAFITTLNISATGSPEFVNLPSQLNPTEGTQYTTSSPLIDLTSHVVPGSGHVTVITASLTSGTLNAAGLSYSTETHEITGTYNGTYAGTQTTLSITATNSIGNSTTTTVPVVFSGLPVRNSDANVTVPYNPGQSITAVNLASFFTNPANSGALSFSASDKSSIVVYGPGNSETSLADSVLGKSGGLQLASNILCGAIPSDTPTGTYIIDCFAKNSVGYATQKAVITLNINQADEPQFSLPSTLQVVYLHSYSQSLPLVNIGGQVEAGSGTIQSITAALKTGQLSDIGLSYVYNSPSSAYIEGSFTQSTLRGTTRTLVVSATNQPANKTATKDITLQLVAAPEYNSTSPSAQTVERGSTMTAVNLASSFTNFTNSGDLSFAADNSASIQVTDPSGNTKTLAASVLGGSSGLQVSGSSLTGTVPSYAEGGVYTFSIHAKNSIGYSVNAATFKLTVTGKPVRNATANQTLSLKQGQTFTAVDLASFFDNPNGSSDAMTFVANNKASIEVTGPSGSTDLASSALGGSGGLSLTGTSLSGAIPSTTLTGTYVIAFFAHNSSGYAGQSGTITLNINDANAPQFTTLPTSLTVKQGQIFGKDGNPSLLEIANHVVAGDGTITSINAELTSGSTLGAAGLSFNHNPDYSSATIDGTVNGVYAGMTKTLQITATNSNNKTATTTLSLVFKGLPTRNSTSVAPISYQRGASITAINLANYFTNPNPGGSLSFAADNSSSIEVTNPDGSQTTLANSPLGASGGLTVSQTNLTGSILNSAPEGTYKIIFHAQNSVGFAANSATLLLTVNSPDSPVFTNVPATLTADQGHAYTSAAPLLDLASHVTAGSGTLSNISASFADGSTLAEAGLTFTFATSPSLIAQITGTPKATFAGQTKTLHIVATNSNNQTATFNIALTFRGLPGRNGSANFSRDLNTGDSFTSVTLANYFTNPANSGALTFSATNKQSIEVAAPDGNKTSLNASPLGSASGQSAYLSLSNGELVGTIPSNAPTGDYTITVNGQNSVGYSESPLTISLKINTVAVPSFSFNPTAATVGANQAYTLTNLAQFFTGTGPLTFDTDPSDTTNARVIMPDGSTSSLANSGLGLTIYHQGSSNTYNLGTKVSDNAVEGVYKIEFKAHNSAGWSTKFAQLTLTVTVNGPSFGSLPASINVDEGTAYTTASPLINLGPLVQPGNGSLTNVTVELASGEGTVSSNAR